FHRLQHPRARGLADARIIVEDERNRGQRHPTLLGYVLNRISPFGLVHSDCLSLGLLFLKLAFTVSNSSHSLCAGLPTPHQLLTEGLPLNPNDGDHAVSQTSGAP